MTAQTKSDLYSTLGVHKAASKNDIKRAYRRKAKQHHPDKNGSVVKWHAVQEAYETLSDDASRARYDATGEIGGRPQLLRDKAIAELARLFIMLAERLDTKHADLLREARAHVTNAQGAQASDLLKTKAKAAKLMDAAERLTVKGDAENFLAGALSNQADVFNRMAAQMEEQCRVLNEALRLLEEFSYRTDGGPSSRTFAWDAFSFEIQGI